MSDLVILRLVISPPCILHVPDYPWVDTVVMIDTRQCFLLGYTVHMCLAGQVGLRVWYNVGFNVKTTMMSPAGILLKYQE